MRYFFLAQPEPHGPISMKELEQSLPDWPTTFGLFEVNDGYGSATIVAWPDKTSNQCHFISPERVLAAYKKTGWGVITKRYVDRAGRRCCPITVLAMEANPYYATGGPLTRDAIYNTLKLPDFYLDGFMAGVDGYNLPSQREMAQKGYEDGVRVRKALQKQGLLTV